MVSMQIAAATQSRQTKICGNLSENEAEYRGMASKHSKTGGEKWAWEAGRSQALAPIFRSQLDYSAHFEERYRGDSDSLPTKNHYYLLSPMADVTPSEMLVLTSRASSHAHIFRTISIMRTPLMQRKSMIAINPIRFQME